MQTIKHNYEIIMGNIRAAARRADRDLRDITLVAVSKTTTDAAVEEAIKLGMRDFGENRAQNLQHRAEHFKGVRWHLIGQLQTNKVKGVVGKTCLIHSLDRWSLAEEIDHQSGRSGIITPVLLEVNVAGEAQKGGMAPDELDAFIMEAPTLKHLQVQGLMCMAPLSERAEESRPVFRYLAERFRHYQQYAPAGVMMQHLSMGMSQDYAVAVEEGATMLRVGSALFQTELD